MRWQVSVFWYRYRQIWETAHWLRPDLSVRSVTAATLTPGDNSIRSARRVINASNLDAQGGWIRLRDTLTLTPRCALNATNKRRPRQPAISMFASGRLVNNRWKLDRASQRDETQAATPGGSGVHGALRCAQVPPAIVCNVCTCVSMQMHSRGGPVRKGRALYRGRFLRDWRSMISLGLLAIISRAKTPKGPLWSRPVRRIASNFAPRRQIIISPMTDRYDTLMQGGARERRNGIYVTIT